MPKTQAPKKAAAAVVPAELFRCRAEYYKGDRPHYWFVNERGDEQFYHAPEGRRPKHTVKTCAEHQKPVRVTAAMLFNLIKLEGFTNSTHEETWGFGGGKQAVPVFKTTGDGITIEIKFHSKADEMPQHDYDSLASGHTSFTTDKGERTFDRTGVDDSFTVYWHDGVAGVQKKLEAQIARVAESRARIARMIPVPGLGFLIDPNAKIKIAEAIRSGHGHSFTPSGFGTGYHLYGGRQRNRWDKRAKAETEIFFGVNPIYIQEMDCD
jgi:hypothetical protein